ncbi:MAG: hypothetical protein CMG46_12840 [Candidatus Marinimicrobia bacterium]|nr:hypothetical protein [Candidatus Neomarinimicrobiota bacterium]
MTEVVITLVTPQFDLLAQRQQAAADERESSINLNLQTVADGKKESASTANTFNDSASQERKPGERRQQDKFEGTIATGPSKPRVELKRIDFGLTPAEVVGTIDVLQRLDDNGDGRVNLMESQQAQVVRKDTTTFEGLAVAPIRSQGYSSAPELQETVGPTGAEDVPVKFYGQGAEVIIGQFVAPNDVATKYSDKAPSDARSEGAVSEDGSGEIKYYDKASQSDTQQSFGDAREEDSGGPYEKAKQFSPPLQSDGGGTEQKKIVQTEFTSYSSSGEVADGRQTPSLGATDVTV